MFNFKMTLRPTYIFSDWFQIWLILSQYSYLVVMSMKYQPLLYNVCNYVCWRSFVNNCTYMCSNLHFYYVYHYSSHILFQNCDFRLCLSGRNHALLILSIFHRPSISNVQHSSRCNKKVQNLFFTLLSPLLLSSIIETKIASLTTRTGSPLTCEISSLIFQ